MEKSTGASGNQNCGDTGLSIQVTGTLQKWSDRFFVWSYKALHEGVTHHKVGGRGIFIQQEHTASRLHAFDDACSLRSTSAGVVCGEAASILTVWKVIDEHGDVHIFDEASVLGTELQGRIIGQDIFPPVSGNVIVYTHIQSIQQSGFAVIATAYDERDALWNSHTVDGAFMWQFHSDAQGFRGSEGFCIFHWAGRYAAFSRQDSSVSYKSHQFSFFHFFTNGILIFAQIYGLLHFCSIQIAVIKGLFHTYRQKIK